MRRDHAMASLLVLCAVLVPASRATGHTTGPVAGTYLPYAWTGSDLQVDYQFAAEVPAGAMRDRIRDGAAQWNAIGRSVQFVLGGPTPSGYDPMNRPCISTTPYQQDGIWYRTILTSDTLAVTRTCAINGSLRVFDITFDSSEPTGWYPGTGNPGYLFPIGYQVDTWSVAAHEFGHGAGFSIGCDNLGHYCANDPTICPSGIARHTMCPSAPDGSTNMRTVEPHDIHTFGSAYQGETFCPSGGSGWIVYGAIRAKYLSAGIKDVVLGCPTVEEHDVDQRGRAQHFANPFGSIFWHATTGAYEVHGAIRDWYFTMGGPASTLGFPVTDEQGASDGVGRFNHFRNPSGLVYGCPGVSGSGSIYFRPDTWVHSVHGAFWQLWCAKGWEGQPGYPDALGYPTMEQSSLGVGSYQHFRRLWEGTTCGENNNASIYSHPSTAAGPNEVHGLIRVKWCAMGWENSLLGWPVTNETTDARGGRYNHFRNLGTAATCGTLGNGSIYWRSGAASAAEVHGAIREKWCALGWEAGFLGYPVGDEEGSTGLTTNPTGRLSRFEAGRVYWSSATGAHEVHGLILDRYLADGGPGTYGFPKTDEFGGSEFLTGRSYRQSDFEGASIRSYADGEMRVCPGTCPV